MVAFVPEDDTRQHAHSCQTGARKPQNPSIGEDARTYHYREENHTERKGQIGIIGYRCYDQFNDTEIVHKNLVAFIAPITPGNPAGQMPPPEPSADRTGYHSYTESIAVLPEAVAHEP